MSGLHSFLMPSRRIQRTNRNMCGTFIKNGLDSVIGNIFVLNSLITAQISPCIIISYIALEKGKGAVLSA